VKSSVQGSAEHVHFSSFVHISSSGISAPFLVPFTKFPVPLWGVMYILDHFILRFWGNELVFEGIFKGLPRSVIDRVCCKYSCDMVTSPVSCLGFLFEVS